MPPLERNRSGSVGAAALSDDDWDGDAGDSREALRTMKMELADDDWLRGGHGGTSADKYKTYRLRKKTHLQQTEALCERLLRENRALHVREKKLMYLLLMGSQRDAELAQLRQACADLQRQLTTRPEPASTAASGAAASELRQHVMHAFHRHRPAHDAYGDFGGRAGSGTGAAAAAAGASFSSQSSGCVPTPRRESATPEASPTPTVVAAAPTALGGDDVGAGVSGPARRRTVGRVIDWSQPSGRRPPLAGVAAGPAPALPLGMRAALAPGPAGSDHGVDGANFGALPPMRHRLGSWLTDQQRTGGASSGVWHDRPGHPAQLNDVHLGATGGSRASSGYDHDRSDAADAGGGARRCRLGPLSHASGAASPPERRPRSLAAPSSYVLHRLPSLPLFPQLSPTKSASDPSPPLDLRTRDDALPTGATQEAARATQEALPPWAPSSQPFSVGGPSQAVTESQTTDECAGSGGLVRTYGFVSPRSIKHSRLVPAATPVPPGPPAGDADDLPLGYSASFVAAHTPGPAGSPARLPTALAGAHAGPPIGPNPDEPPAALSLSFVDRIISDVSFSTLRDRFIERLLHSTSTSPAASGAPLRVDGPRKLDHVPAASTVDGSTASPRRRRGRHASTESVPPSLLEKNGFAQRFRDADGFADLAPSAKTRQHDAVLDARPSLRSSGASLQSDRGSFDPRWSGLACHESFSLSL